MPDLDNEMHLILLRYLAKHSQVSQRELAQNLGVSLGKVNYCLQALVDNGLIKARSFKNSHNRRAYVYLLTPKGIKAKEEITVRFLQRKMQQNEVLRAEIAELRKELKKDGVDGRQ